MNPEERINNPKYLNWIKGTLAFMHLCDVVRNYAYHTFDKFLDTISDRRHYDSGSNYKFLADRTEWDSSQWKYTTTYQCVCQSLFKEILRLHFFGDKRIGFANCKDKTVGGPWGLAKFFMPVSKYCADIERPEETEPTTVLKMIQNCSLFKHIEHLNIEIIIDSRNAMMHSSLNNINDADLAKYIDGMVNFLNDAMIPEKNSNIRQQLNKAQREIRELRYASMRVDLLPENAERAINFKKRLVIGSIKRQYEEADVAKLGEYLDILDELGGDLLAWNKKSWEIGKLKEIGNYREMLVKATAEKDEAIKCLNETREELDNVKIELNDTMNKLHAAENKIFTMQRELKDTQERLDAITEENKDKQDELNSTKNQLDSATKENERLQDELNETIENLDAVTEKNERLRDELNATRERLDIKTQENERIKDELNDIIEKLDAETEENEKLRDELNETCERLDVATQENERIKDKLNETKEELDAVTGQNKILGDELNATRDELNATRERLNVATNDYNCNIFGMFSLFAALISLYFEGS